MDYHVTQFWPYLENKLEGSIGYFLEGEAWIKSFEETGTCLLRYSKNTLS